MHILSSRIIFAFLMEQSRDWKYFTAVLFHLLPFVYYPNNVNEELGVKKKRNGSRHTALSGTADWNLKVTGRETEREGERATEQFRLSRVLLCYSLTHCAILCVYVCEVFKASSSQQTVQSRPALCLSSITFSVAVSFCTLPFFFLLLSIPSPPATCPSTALSISPNPSLRSFPTLARMHTCLPSLHNVSSVLMYLWALTHYFFSISLYFFYSGLSFFS